MNINQSLFAGLTISFLVCGISWAKPDTDEVIDKMMTAHGGFETWADSETVGFQYRMFRGTATTAPLIQVLVKQDERWALVDYPELNIQTTWDGEKAWSVGGPPPVPARFNALLQYYFLNLPWLTQDDGVILGPVKEEQLKIFEGTVFSIRMTFEAGVGDTPEDYYVLYIDPESFRLRGCEYIVTYKEILPEGKIKSSPKKLAIDQYEEVKGLLVPTQFTIYDEKLNVALRAEISNWLFDEAFPKDRLNVPENAIMDTLKP